MKRETQVGICTLSADQRGTEQTPKLELEVKLWCMLPCCEVSMWVEKTKSE